MTDGKAQVTVQIFGKEYALRAGDDPSYVVRIAKFLDERLREISHAQPNRSPFDVAVLAGLNIADQLYRALEKTEAENEPTAKTPRKKSERGGLSDSDVQRIRKRVAQLIEMLPE